MAERWVKKKTPRAFEDERHYRLDTLFALAVRAGVPVAEWKGLLAYADKLKLQLPSQMAFMR